MSISLLHATPVVNIPCGDGGQYCTVGDAHLIWREAGLQWRLDVPHDFPYDGASVPRWVTALAGIERDLNYRDGATFHDYIYRYAGEIPWEQLFIYRDDRERWEPNDRPIPRAVADELFHYLLCYRGVPKHRAWLAYRGVRAGGWRPWNKARARLLKIGQGQGTGLE